MVEWKSIENLGTYFGGLTGKTKEDFVDGNAKFITYMNVFNNPSLNTSTTGVVRIGENEKQNKIQKGDILFTGSSETPEEAGMSCVVTEELSEAFYMNSFCFGLRIDNSTNINLHYLKHILRSNNIRKEITKSASGVTRFNISKARFGKILIPIPSLSEQERIVGILDTFTSAIDNLKAQIAQRRKQYEFYRDQLLDLEGKPGVEMKTLGEVCEVCTGGEVPNNTIKGQLSATEEYPYAVYANGKETYGYSKTYQIAEDAVCISSIGANTGAVFYKKGKFTPAIRLKVLIPKDGVITKYLFYASSKIDFRGKNTGSVPNINANYVKNKQIPLPPLQEQQRIVSILDTFEASIANLEAQLKQREKQYEYYRNKLLTFE